MLEPALHFLLHPHKCLVPLMLLDLLPHDSQPHREVTPIDHLHVSAQDSHKLGPADFLALDLLAPGILQNVGSYFLDLLRELRAQALIGFVL